jgi:transcriptional regulator with XRE-family HTH domain
MQVDHTLLEVGTRVKTIRTAMNLSQDFVAKTLGFNNNTPISYIERGMRQPDIQTLTFFGDKIGVKPADILKGTKKYEKAVAGIQNTTAAKKVSPTPTTAKPKAPSLREFATTGTKKSKEDAIMEFTNDIRNGCITFYKKEIPKSVYKGVGERIKAIRDALGMERNRFSLFINMTRTSLSNYENGMLLPPKAVVRFLAHVVGATEQEMLFGGKSWDQKFEKYKENPNMGIKYFSLFEEEVIEQRKKYRSLHQAAYRKAIKEANEKEAQARAAEEEALKEAQMASVKEGKLGLNEETTGQRYTFKVSERMKNILNKYKTLNATQRDIVDSLIQAFAI